MSNAKQSTTLAFLGATGGCTLAVLVRSLNAGLPCRALVRTPSKLLALVKAAGVPDTTVDSGLAVVEGAAQDGEAVKQLLRGDEGKLVGRIVFGIGAKPRYSGNPFLPVGLDDPTVCETSMASLLSAIAALPYSTPPLLAAVSTTGLAARRDVPLLFLPLYHWLLHGPHKDKRKMEEAIAAAGEHGVLRGFVVVSASLLTDGPAAEDQIRVGEGDRRAIGYTISRESVGAWIFSNLVQQGDAAWGAVKTGRRVVLTY